MTVKELKHCIVNNANDLYFMYNGKNCGIEQTVRESVAIYEIWCGKETKQHQSLNELLSDKFFDGKSISELLDIVEISFA